ncbi:MAG: HNH endonuclease, partial [Bacteroidales bacterium]|nr:HNH endonuclease [Bacteroidales bacterium]
SLLGEGKGGYDFIRFDSIPEKHLEHIAPQTKTNDEPISAGYCEYDEEFINKYLNCMGNYLLLSAPHNESIGNKPFELKRSTYTQLLQQREVQDMTPDIVWDKSKISTRQSTIKAFIESIY